MRAGITLVKWFGNEAKRIYAMLDEGEEDTEQRKLVNWIERKGGVVAVRDLTHGLREYRGNTDQAKADMDALVNMGSAQWEYPSGPGRPSPKLRLVASVTGVTDTETTHHNSISDSFGDGDGGDAESARISGDGDEPEQPPPPPDLDAIATDCDADASREVMA